MGHYVRLFFWGGGGGVAGCLHFSSTMRKEHGREVGTHYRLHFSYTELREAVRHIDNKDKTENKSNVGF